MWGGDTEMRQIYQHSKNNTDGSIYYRFNELVDSSDCANKSLIALKKSNKLSSGIYAVSAKRTTLYPDFKSQRRVWFVWRLLFYK